MKYCAWALGIIFLLFVVYVWEFHTVVSDENEPVVIAIAPGDTLNKISTTLSEKNLIRSPTLFSWYVRLHGVDRDLKAGRFTVDPNLTPASILEQLSNPSYGELSITIPEGATITEIDEKLMSLGVINEGEFIAATKNYDTKKFSFLSSANLEGYLFPDTYLVFANHFEPEDFIDTLLKTFQKKALSNEKVAAALKSNTRTLSDIIIMASILEKEVKTVEDYPLIAGLLWKRLDNDWPLQVDSTLLYGKKDRSLSYKDLQTDSPYNTYTRRGLPAGPIGTPGLTTVIASAFPTESPYWFYLTDKNGTVIYSKTNEEHEENKRKYL